MTSQGTTLLDNDWDPEGSTITATLVDNPTHGSISRFGSDGTFTYTLTDKYGNKIHFDSSGKITSRVDQVGQPSGNSVAEKRVDFAFNALGQYTSVTRYKATAGGASNEVMESTFTYDSLNRLTKLEYKNSSGSNIVSPFQWTYDSLSTPGLPAVSAGGVSLPGDPRVAATAVLAAPLGSGRITQMTGEDGTVDYGYDATSQLTSANYSDPSLTDESYSFDLVGNRTMTGTRRGRGTGCSMTGRMRTNMMTRGTGSVGRRRRRAR